MATLGAAPIEAGGMTIYRVPPAELAPWRNATALAMETRLDRARFAALVLAAESYLHDGRPPAALTPAEVYKLGLMPAGWIVVPKKTEPPWDDGGMNLPRHPNDPHQLDDLWLGVDEQGRIEVGVTGWYPALRAVLSEYRADAIGFVPRDLDAAGARRRGRPSRTARDDLQRRRPRARRGTGAQRSFFDGGRRRIAMSVSGTAAASASGWRGGAAAFLIYLGLSMLFFGRALGGGLSSFYVGNGPDPPQSIWFLAWWAHALADRVNPFFTHAVWAPGGFNLAWTTNIPLAAWLMLPVTRTLGAVAAYNILCLLCPAVVGWAAFVLCRHIVREFAPALLGGFVFGFSPYLICKLLGDIDLALVPMLPLAVYLTLRALDGTMRRRTFIVLLALVLSAQFLLFIETFATMTMSAAIAIAIALLVTGESDRGRIRALIAPIALSYALAMLLLAPYLYYLFAFGFPHGAIWSTNTGSIDLLNFLVPVPTNALGRLDAMRAISVNFRAGIYDTDAYLGLTLVAAIAMAWRRWHEPAVRLLILFAAAIGVLAMGSWMQVGGHFIVPMPWMIVSALPLIAKAMPARLTVYMFLAIAILCAMWMSARPRGASDRVALLDGSRGH